MKMLKKSLTIVLLLVTSFAMAQKTVYIPNEWKTGNMYKESDPNNTYMWSKSRSLENDNIIIFWDKGYGSTAPNKLATSNAYYVDINDLLQKCQAFYDLECSQLGFVNVATSNLSKYKVMVMLSHDSEWNCTGAGYDYQVPALWITPSTCKPVGSAIAHEVGHSFHYMCYCEASQHGATAGIETGFHSNWSGSQGQAIWETTANWQALQSYPDEFFSEMYGVYQQTHNYAFSHEWHRYQAYPFLYYLTEKYNDIKAVANVWNQAETTPKDFNQALMDNKSLSAEDLYRMYYEYASKCVTWDFAALRSNSNLTAEVNQQIGNFDYNCIKRADGAYQVAYRSCPQASGFNVVPLSGFRAGQTVSVDFTAMAPACALSSVDAKQYVNGETAIANVTSNSYNRNSYASRRGFRLGFVALKNDGTRLYSSEDKVYCTGTAEATTQISYTVPTGVQKLWMVVVPAPSTYVRHDWDDDVTDDDQWPYRFELTNATLGSKARVAYESDVTTLSYTYNIERQPNLGYTATTFDYSDDLAAALAFLGCTSVNETTPVHIYGDTRTTELAEHDGWMTADGRIDYWGGSGSVSCIKFFPKNNSIFNICTMPGTDGDELIGSTYTTTYALEANGKTVEFHVNVNFQEEQFDWSPYSIVSTYNYTYSAKPAQEYGTVQVLIDAAQIASDLGLTDLAASTYYCTTTKNALFSATNASDNDGYPGFWLNADGQYCAWGGDARVYVCSDRSSMVSVGQFPGQTAPGDVYPVNLYFGNGNKLVKVTLSVIMEKPDYVVVGSYNCYLNMATDNDYIAKNVAFDGAKIAADLGLSSLSSANFLVKTVDGEYSNAVNASNEVGTGFWLNATGQRCEWGDDACLYVCTDKSGLLSVGQMPYKNAGGERYAYVLYFANGEKLVKVTLNVGITFPTSLQNLARLIELAQQGEASLDEIKAMLDALLLK